MADCKVASTENMAYIYQQQGRFPKNLELYDATLREATGKALSARAMVNYLTPLQSEGHRIGWS